MTFADKHIVETYTQLFEGLNEPLKLELIKNLTEGITNKRHTREENFYASFGAFASDKSPEDIVREIKSSRNFRDKEIEF